jgi:photosystem II stability/assembly factor-like uncharacterized protein
MQASTTFTVPKQFVSVPARHRFWLIVVWICTACVLVVPALGQWQLAPVASSAVFRGVNVVDDKVAWVCGQHGTVARSVDGGRTWTIMTIPDASKFTLVAIAGFNVTVAVTATGGPAEKGFANIYRTVDGGKNWTQVYSTHQKGVFFDTLAFWDANNGLALSDPVDGHAFLLRTDDGGKSWKQIPSTHIPAALPGEQTFATSASCLVMFGTRDAWIGTGAGTTARVFWSTDRGQTWNAANTPVQTNSTAGISAVAFRDARHGVAVGGDLMHGAETKVQNVAITEDGGYTWRAARGRLPQAFLSGVSYADNGKTVIAVGPSGTYVSVNGGDSWIGIDTLPMNSVRFTRDGKLGVAVGPGGHIAYFLGSPAARIPTGDDSGRRLQ